MVWFLVLEAVVVFCCDYILRWILIWTTYFLCVVSFSWGIWHCCLFWFASFASWRMPRENTCRNSGHRMKSTPRITHQEGPTAFPPGRWRNDNAWRSFEGKSRRAVGVPCWWGGYFQPLTPLVESWEGSKSCNRSLFKNSSGVGGKWRWLIRMEPISHLVSEGVTSVFIRSSTSLYVQKKDTVTHFITFLLLSILTYT